ncbi:SDR family NAD(P)-dependent oxidoreductase [Actinoplanes sp. TRM 88003]|uniref:SDR family NAD(P)-dependent oxidoreductase n=1 Tax=Paractinoplanes aksuensis TaxID=2939490 RepID=A0ABT1DKF3_9ACTN|nr:SDR family NAD(P)-dependent oxidoreductase [Actinoplanes aksuensis]MCO8271317.1 SDR family NAD(P)-dependent oxidoreductase [Actinoplanes aksuensis]
MPTILMNGASRGIGLHAARHMLDADPTLRLIVLARGEQPDLPRTTVLRADLTSLDSLRKAAAQISEPVDGYVGNAGIQLTNTTTTTTDGYETTFAVNVLAHHLLLRLVPLTDRARVVITGSDAHFGDFRHNLGLVPAPRWTSPDQLARPNPGRSGRGAYADSKLGVLYLVHALARRGVDAYTWNPSFTPGTGLVRADRIGNVLFRRVFPLIPGVNTAERAGAQLAAAATGPLSAPAGSYIDRSTVTRSSDESYDEAREDELWSAAERLVS